MSRLAKLGCLIMLLATGYTLSAINRLPAGAKRGPVATAGATLQATAGYVCNVTTPIRDEPPKDPNADPFGLGYWYINSDRTLWAGIVPRDDVWRAGGEKTVWIRPAGTRLTVSGHRLDAEAPPLHAEIPCCYPTGFQVAGLIFPTEGCWQVNARAGNSELNFVTEVGPSRHPVPGNDTCGSLVEIVRESDVVAVGTVSTVETEGRYSWYTLRVMGTWKLPPGWSSIGDKFSLLLDHVAEPGLEANKTYVLFMHYEPWRLVCAQRTVIEWSGERASPIGNDPVWTGTTIGALKTEISRLANER